MKRGSSYNPPSRPNLARPKSGHISPTEALLRAGSAKMTLRWALGNEVYDRLSLRQANRLAVQVGIVHGWYTYALAAGIRRDNAGAAQVDFCRAVRPWWGRSFSPTTLRRWLRAVALQGLAGLVDRRGRRQGVVRPVDVESWVELLWLIARGVSLAKAHAQLAVRARRENRAWLSLRTIQQRLHPGAASSFLLKPTAGEGD